MERDQNMAFMTREKVKEKVKQYKDKKGYSSQSKALEDLVETGLRENTNPVVSRWYDATIRWVGFVMVVAILSLVAGLTGVIETMDAAKFAMGCLFVAVILLSMVEGARLYYGQSELGAWIRGED